MQPPRPMLALAALALTAPALFSQVLVVDDDGGPGVDHLQISDAVAGAPDGAIVLVRDGGYEPFAIEGKAVAVLAANDATVRVHGRIEVRDLISSQLVVLRGLTTGETADDGLLAENCAGSLRVEECSLRGEDMTTDILDAYPAHGAHVRDCDDVWFVRCQLIGGDGANVGFFGQPYAGGAGLAVERSTVAIADCLATGGEGPSGPIDDWYSGAPGMSGVDAFDARLWISGLVAVGGDGGDGHDDYDIWVGKQCGDGGDGGDGVLLRPYSFDWTEGPTPSTVDVRGLFASPGSAGSATCGFWGTAGVPLDLGDGTVPHVANEHPGLGAVVYASSPAAGGGTLRLWSEGVAGDWTLAAIGTPSPVLALPGQTLPLALLDAPLVLDLGTIPPGGVDLTALPLGTFGPSFTGTTLHLQGIVIPSGTTAVELAPAGTLTLLP